MSSKEKGTLLAGMVLSMLCWGLSWPSAKVLASYGATESIGFLRFMFTFLSLVPVLLYLKEPLKVSLQGLPYMLLSGVCLGAYQFCFLEGVKIGMAGTGGVVVTTLNPIITAILLMMLSRKVPGRMELAGLGIGLVAGIVLLKLWVNYQRLELPMLYFLSAATIWAVLSRFTSMAQRFGSALSFSLWTYLICSLLMALFTEGEENWRLLQLTDFWFWFNMFFSSTITTAGATTFYFYATSKIGADKASNFMFMVPLSAALGSWIFLQEVQHWNTLVGGAIGLVAVYILNRKEKK